MLRFWFCRSHFGVFQGCVYKIWSLNPTRSIFEGIFWKRLSIKCLPCRISTLKRSCPLDKYFWLPNTFQEQALMWKLFRNNFEFKYYSGELPTVGIIRSKICGRGVRINYNYSGVCWRGGYAKVAGIVFAPFFINDFPDKLLVGLVIWRCVFPSDSWFVQLRHDFRGCSAVPIYFGVFRAWAEGTRCYIVRTPQLTLRVQLWKYPRVLESSKLNQSVCMVLFSSLSSNFINLWWLKIRCEARTVYATCFLDSWGNMGNHCFQDLQLKES